MTLDPPHTGPISMDINPNSAVFETDLPLPGRRQGKVRDIYQIPPSPRQPPAVLIIATDRVSAFDVVLPTPIPGKGILLTDISVCWFNFLRDLNLIPDHLISTDPADMADLNPEQKERIRGRMMLGRAAGVIPIEFVVRGYITGSGWLEYQKTGAVCGISLPAGLPQCAKLAQPIFTPATKAEEGHDENISYETASDRAGFEVMKKLRDISLTMYAAAAEYAAKRGVILADTKFEFGYALDERGRPTDEIILIDEVLTPDSSRYWPADQYEPGRDQESFDKQFVRNHLQELVAAGKWKKQPPGPELPEHIINGTLERYREARNRLFPAPTSDPR